MVDEIDPRKLRLAGAICCFTGDEIEPREIIQIVVQLGHGAEAYQTFFTTPDRLRAAFDPSIDVDFDAFDEEDGAS